MDLVVATWNVDWAGGGRGKAVRSVLNDVGADVLCVTEGTVDLLAGDGRQVTSQADYGYAKAPAKRRKVLLWTAHDWTDVDDFGSPELPSGRYVAARLASQVPVTFIGVCIPWKDAHVRTGRKDRELWEDHERFLSGLGEILGRIPGPRVLLGDFNQTVPRTRAPERVHGRLLRLLEDSDLNLVTGGHVPGCAKPLIDHIAISPEISCEEVVAWSAEAGDGSKPLSDHSGVKVRLKVA